MVRYLGVAAFATEPDAIHEYSQGHPFYRREETEAKAEQWRANATGELRAGSSTKLTRRYASQQFLREDQLADQTRIP